MATNVTLFYGYTPNTSGGVHVTPSRPFHLYDWYTANKRMNEALKSFAPLDISIDKPYIETLEAGTYLIYADYVDIKKQLKYDGLTISYISIDDGKRVTFYFVDSVTPLPQGYRLYTRLDVWATYISIAMITNVHFTRSNLQVGSGKEYLYLTDDKTNYDSATRYYQSGLGRNLTRKNITVLAVIKHKVYQNFSKSIEVIKMYAFDPIDIARREDREELTAQDIYDTVNAVAAIYGISDDKGGEGSAEVMHIYLQDSTVFASSGLQAFKTVDKNGGAFELEGWTRRPSINEYNIIVMNEAGDYVINPAAINYSQNEYIKVNAVGVPLYFGTKYNYLKLPPFVLTYSVKIREEITDDKFQVSIIHNNEARDITSAFEVVAVANTASLTSSQSIAKWLGISAQAAGGVFQTVKGGAGLVTGPLSIAAAFTGLVNQNGGTVIGSGNGLITFYDIIHTNSGDIWHFARGTRQTDGAAAMKKIIYYGASCDIQTDSPDNNLLTYLKNRPPLYRRIGATTPDGNVLPVIACVAAVDNIPTEAADMIASRLLEGIRIQFYDA